MYKLPKELANDLRSEEIRKFQEKSLKCLELMVCTQPATRKANFDSWATNCEKSAVQHSQINIPMKNLFYLIL